MNVVNEDSEDNIINIADHRRIPTVIFEAPEMSSYGDLVFHLQGWTRTILQDNVDKIEQVILIAKPVRRGYRLPLNTFLAFNIQQINGCNVLILKKNNRTLKKYLIWDHNL